MTKTYTQAVALLTALTYGRAMTQMVSPRGEESFVEFEKAVIFVPRGEQPTVRDLNEGEVKAWAEIGPNVNFKPTKCIEFERAFMFGGQDGERMEPMMFGTGFGIYVEDSGEPTDRKDVTDITYRLACALLGRGGDPYTGLQQATAELTLKELRFCFAQTLEVVQSNVRHKAHVMIAKQREEALAYGRKITDELTQEYVGDVFGQDFKYLFTDEPEDGKAVLHA